MSKGAINFTENNEWYTPNNIVNMFGIFEYDPATTEEKAKELGIANFDTEETNGLTSEWGGYKSIWINPPFTIKHLFFEKACETYSRVKNDIYFLAPIGFLTTKRFHNILNKYQCGVKLYLPNGRIKFESKLNSEAKSPAFGTVVMKIGDKCECERLDITRK